MENYVIFHSIIDVFKWVIDLFVSEKNQINKIIAAIKKTTKAQLFIFLFIKSL